MRLLGLADTIVGLANDLAIADDVDIADKNKFRRLSTLLTDSKAHLKVLVAVLNVFVPVIRVSGD